jgi:siroheme decarboxylase
LHDPKFCSILSSLPPDGVAGPNGGPPPGRLSVRALAGPPYDGRRMETETNTAAESPVATLTQLDRRLLGELQADVPLSVTPFADLGERLGIGEAEVVERVTALRAAGILRHVTAIFDAEALGYASCLVAARIPAERLEAAASVVSAHPGVSHNYVRNHSFNLWYTIAVPPALDLAAHVDALRRLTGAESMRMLPSVRRFKIGVSLDVTGERDMFERSEARHTGGLTEGAERLPLTQRDIDVIRAVQGDLPLTAHPFVEAARSVGMSEQAVVDVLRDLGERGCLRRLGGILRHRRAGFSANGMAAWRVPEADIVRIGETMAGYTAISHCYQRTTYDDWPYSLFTMIHAPSVEECDAFVAELARAHGLDDYAVLYSSTEYKKVRPIYFSSEVEAWDREYVRAAAK